MNSFISSNGDTTRMKLIKDKDSSRYDNTSDINIELKTINKNINDEHSILSIPVEGMEDYGSNNHKLYFPTEDKSQIHQNFFFNFNNKDLDLFSFEKAIINEYEDNIIQYSFKKMIKKDDENTDQIIKMKIQDDFLESSIINSEGNNRKFNILNPNNNKDQEENKLQGTHKKNEYYKHRLYYYEKIINIILLKYTPEIFKDDRNDIFNQKITNENYLKLQSLDNYKNYHYYMSELEKKVITTISQLQFGNGQKLDKNIKMLGSQAIPLKELHAVNQENTLLKIIIYTIYKYPLDSLSYITWKIYLLNLISKWRFQKEYFTVKKYKIKYLKAKFILEKVLKNKQKKNISKYFENNMVNLKEDKSLFRPSELFGTVSKKSNLPSLSFYPDSTVMVIYDMLVDIHILYFLMVCPMIFVLKFENVTVDLFSFMFNILYFFDIIRRFRRLRYTETNVLILDINAIFKETITQFCLLLDIFSLIPFYSFYSNVTKEGVGNLYWALALTPVLRMPNCGKSIEYLEKTKYALTFRLILLLLRFLIFAHWIGLLFVAWVSFDYFTDDYKLDASCRILEDGQPILTSNCKYLIALFDGEYIIPGGYFAGISLIDSFSGRIGDYLFMFFAFLAGQIIVAYIFGGVNDLIKNLNQASNIYRDKLDRIKNFMIFYDYDQEVKTDVELLYEYVWQKKRNSIYDDAHLFYGLSETLYVKVKEQVSPHFRYFLKDFYGLSHNKQHKLIYTLISNMKEYLAFPYEKIYSQGQLVRGLFILTDGNAIFTDGLYKEDGLEDHSIVEETTVDKTRFDFNHKITVNRNEILKKMKFNRRYNVKELMYPEEFLCFPLDSIFLKTGRAIETCYVDDFCDFYLINLDFFDKVLIENFPAEMLKLKKKGQNLGNLKIGKNKRIRELVLKHSARSVDHYYEDEFNLTNAWIDIKYEIPTVIDKGNMTFEEETYYDTRGLLEFNFNSIVL